MAVDPTTDASGGWAPPTVNDQMKFSFYGSSGLRQYGGWVREEFLSQLQGRLAAQTYREMADNSPIVGALIFAISQSMRKIEWRVTPADDTPEAAAEAEFLDSCRDDMSSTWSDTTTEMLSQLIYGFAPLEIVYKRRLGRKVAKGKPTSKFDDGRIGWRKLPLRGQDTIFKWFFDENGETTGMSQQPWMGPIIDIPIEKLLLFRPTAHKGNPEGRSILRTAYRSWYLAKRIEEQEAVLIERFGGIPKVTVPAKLMADAMGTGPDAAAAQQALQAYQRIATNVRVDEQMGVVFPSDTWKDDQGKPTTAKMYDFELVTPTFGRSSIDPSTVIERYNLQILMSVLADFINLGHQARGTQNLAISKVDMFFQAIEGWVNGDADVLNRYGVTRLWQMNGLDYDLMPRLMPDMPQRVDLDVLSNFILRLSQSGMQLFPDEDLEDYIRDAAGLPDMADEAATDAMAPGEKPSNFEKMLTASLARRRKQMLGRGSS